VWRPVVMSGWGWWGSRRHRWWGARGDAVGWCLARGMLLGALAGRFVLVGCQAGAICQLPPMLRSPRRAMRA
jgi:hypothetical protein